MRVEMIQNKLYSYSELMQLPDYGDRLAYLKNAAQGVPSPREVSDGFYKSKPWRDRKAEIIKRDLRQDLGIPGQYILKTIGVHHINPLTSEDFIFNSSRLLDPENLICVEMETTHNYIHYQQPVDITTREKGDTSLW